MIARVYPKTLSGSIDAIPSKSMAHRLLICAALSKGVTKVKCPDSSEDIEATVACLRAIGSNVLRIGDSYLVPEITATPCQQVNFNCFESGTTLRFMMCIAAGIGLRAHFDGSDRLFERPLEPLIEVLSKHGIAISRDENNRIIQSGKAFIKDYEIAGNISSQYISGLLLMLPLCGGGSVTVLGDFESKPYVTLTANALSQSGLNISEHNNTYQVSGNYNLENGCVEGDWSNSSFFLVAASLGSDVTLGGLDMQSSQGDRAIIDILRNFGAEAEFTQQRIKVSANSLRGADVDVSDIPDMVPILSVLAANAEGRSELYGAARLRLKESDRLKTVTDMLRGLGGDAQIVGDSIVIEGKGALKGGEVDACRDHRIAMSAAIAALNAQSPVIIHGAEAVNKSYPKFFTHLMSLGAKVELEE